MSTAVFNYPLSYSRAFARAYWNDVKTDCGLTQPTVADMAAAGECRLLSRWLKKEDKEQEQAATGLLDTSIIQAVPSWSAAALSVSVSTANSIDAGEEVFSVIAPPAGAVIEKAEPTEWESPETPFEGRHYTEDLVSDDDEYLEKPEYHYPALSWSVVEDKDALAPKLGPCDLPAIDNDDDDEIVFASARYPWSTSDFTFRDSAPPSPVTSGAASPLSIALLSLDDAGIEEIEELELDDGLFWGLADGALAVVDEE